jgi:hypothetical protein
MGALVASDGGGVGQWGTRLWVSTAPAEELCRAVWGVPAELRPIRFAPRCTTLPPIISRSDFLTCLRHGYRAPFRAVPSPLGCGHESRARTFLE